MVRRAISSVLERQARGMLNADAAPAAELLDALAGALDRRGPRQIPVDNNSQITADSLRDGQTELALTLVNDLSAILEVADAKKAVLADLGRLSRFLEARLSFSFDRILELLEGAKDTGDELFQGLEQSLGSEAFAQTITTLQADRAFAAGQMIELANRFKLRLPASTSKKKAAEALLRMNDVQLGNKLKLKAMAGRSAA